ncbi:MAG: hypothetical protein V4671_33255 [Armatimonadota bacterium]
MKKQLSLFLVLLLALCYSRPALGDVSIDINSNADSRAVIGRSVDTLQDSNLREKISITAPGITLAEIFATISAQCDILLSATRPESDQRFTIITHDLPLHTLMDEIVRVLSHTDSGPVLYEWRKIESKGRNQYTLVSLVSASSQRRTALTAQKKRIRLLLCELRDLLSKPDAGGSEVSSHFMPELLNRRDAFFAVYHQAIRHLSDRDIDTLVQGGQVSVSPSLLTAAVTTLNRDTQEAYADAATRLPQGQALPIPAPLEVKQSPYLRLSPNDFNGEHPGQWFEYAIMLEGVFNGQWVVIDPYYSSEPPLTSPGEEHPLLDLTPNLKEMTLYKDHLPATLIAIARAAKINIVEEHFYKVNRLSQPIDGLLREQQKGKLSTIVNDICRTWKYTAVKNGNIYRLWSLTWPVDRDCDIPERRLTQWRKTLARQGSLTIDDQTRLATELTWGQITVTLRQAFPLDVKAGKGVGETSATFFPFLNSIDQYSRLRLQGLLNGDERRAALSSEGLAIKDLRPELLEEVFWVILIQERIPPTQSRIERVRSQLASARLFLKAPSPAFLKPQPMGVQILATPK